MQTSPVPPYQYPDDGVSRTDPLVDAQACANRYRAAADHVEKNMEWYKKNVAHLGLLACTFELHIDITGVIVFVVEKRDILTHLMTLSPKWKKDYMSDAIRYQAVVDEKDVFLIAYSEAFPPTCKVVTEEVFVPARTETKYRVVCNEKEEQIS